VCRICDVGLVEDPASVGDEGDVYFRDHHDVDPSFPAGHVFLVEVGGEEEFEAVRSVLIDAGIPFVVQGQRPRHMMPGFPVFSRYIRLPE